MRLNRTFRHLFLAAATVPAVGLVGCSSHHDWDDDFHSDRSTRVYHDRSDRVYQQRVVRRERVPSSAHLLDRGRGEVSARAEGRGVVYLYDATNGDIFWTGSVRDGDRITIDPADDRASVNGSTVYQSNLVRDHEHRIYLVHR